VLTLFDTAPVRAVLRGKDGVIAGLRRGGLVIDMGTTDVLATREFAHSVADAGGSYLGDLTRTRIADDRTRRGVL
jgi:2-hydroxy-3-oxopropionate reductase